jgi:hypothetical protein
MMDSNLHLHQRSGFAIQTSGLSPVILFDSSLLSIGEACK